MLSRIRQPLHHVLLARSLFSTETAAPSSKTWTIQQQVGGAVNQTEILNIKPDGKIAASVDDDAQSIHHHTATSSSPPMPWHNLITQQLQSTFLPAGYPRTVSPGYLKFVTWQALHHTAGAANGVLASTFLLYSVGLGAGAIPTAGALSWILKDGLGQLGTLLFGRTMAHNFDLSSRSWYVAASGKLNIAMGLEIATAVAPHWFLPLGATANAVKGLAWMAGGSSRSAFNVAFASDRNIADITAKATSQTICTSLLGTGIGMAIAATIEQSVGLAFGWYSALAAVHMYTAVESAKSVPLATLNPSRLKLLSEIVVSKQFDFMGSSFSTKKSIEFENVEYKSGGYGAPLLSIENLPSPAELAIEDRIFPILGKNRAKQDILSSEAVRKLPVFELVVGTSLEKLASTEAAVMSALLPLYKNRRYILVIDRHGTMHLVLHEEAKTVDAVTAVLHATVWNDLRHQQQQVQQEEPTASPAASPQSAMPIESNLIIMFQEADKASIVAEKLAPSMVDALKKSGWDVQGVVIEPRRRRAVW